MRDEIDREFDDVLAKMTVLLYGPAQTFDKSGGRSSEHPGGRRPTGDNYPLHEEFRERYAQASTRADRARVLAEAIEARQRVLKGPEERSEGETWEQLRDRVVKDGEGWALRDVATAFKITESQARKARRQKGREVEFGLKIPERVPASPKERVQLLASQGLSQREIASQVGLHKTQVARWLAKEAA